MEPTHIFYKELLADDDNIFTANISEKNEEENVKSRKSQEYGISCVRVKPDIGDSSLVKVIDESKLKFLSKKIQEIVKNKREPDLNLTISHGEAKDLIISFKKIRNRLSPYKTYFLQLNNKKNEQIVFYNYYEILKSSVLNGKIQQLTLSFP